MRPVTPEEKANGMPDYIQLSDQHQMKFPPKISDDGRLTFRYGDHVLTMAFEEYVQFMIKMNGPVEIDISPCAGSVKTETNASDFAIIRHSPQPLKIIGIDDAPTNNQ